MNREELKRYYLKDPVLFNARYQAQGKYPGSVGVKTTGPLWTEICLSCRRRQKG